MAVRFLSLLLAVAGGFSSRLQAAPPKVDYLFPAGTQRGTKGKVAAGGLTEPAQGWASHPGIRLVPEKKPGNFLVEVAPEVPCGLHWLRFFNKDGAAPARPFLVNQVAEVSEKEPNDHPKKPQEIASLPVVLNGRLEKTNDADLFAVSLKKGQTLVASVEARRLLRSPMDAVLQVLSAEGFVLAHADDFHDTDPLLAFTVPRDGTYLVRIFCFPAVPDSRVGLYGKADCVYRLTLTTGPFVDHAWPLAVERGKKAVVELVGWNLSSDRKTFPVQVLENEEDAFVQPPGFANGADVRVEPHPCTTSGPLQPPVTFSGRVPDEKGLRLDVPAKKGQRLSFRIEARTLHFPLDPVLTLFDPAGKQLKRVQAAKLHTDPALDFTTAVDGKHVLEVHDLHQQGGHRHVFRLRCLPQVPDFEATLAADRFQTPAGKPLEITATLTRLNGLKEPVELFAEGLGDCKQEQVPSKDPKKTVLRLSGLRPDTQLPFRLFARIQGRKETRRPVPASLDGLPVPHLWLTVSGK